LKYQQKAKILETAERLEKQVKVKKSGNIIWPPFREFAKANLKIVSRGATEDDGLIMFDSWRYGQEVVGDYLERKEKAKEAVELVIHKSRQHSGASTVSQAYMFYKILKRPQRFAMVMAHRKENTEIIFKNVHRFYDNIPEKYRIPAKGGKVGISRLELEEPHGGHFIVNTAGSEESGRGPMLHYFHASELDFWNNPETVLQGVRPSIPKPHEDWDTAVISESTAVGKRHFYNVVENAKKPNTRQDFMFLSWKDEKECAVPIVQGEPLVLNDKEREYQERYQLSDEQMNWAKGIVDNDCNGHWEIFNSEYPVVSELAFMYSGHPWFSQERIESDLANLRTPIFTGSIWWNDIDIELSRSA
jgi:hypothetical protein